MAKFQKRKFCELEGINKAPEFSVYKVIMPDTNSKV